MRRRTSMTDKLAAAFCVLVFALAGPAGADALDDVPGVSIVTYPVSGADAASLRRSIKAQRPTDPTTGEAFDAVTRWQMLWKWSGDGHGGCDLATTRVELRIEVILPELVDSERLPADVVQRWKAYLAALRRHEAGHARHAFEGVEDIRQAISHGDCAHANERGRAVVRRLNQYDVDYDRETQHGILQGTILP